jgi:hypothetical protein
VGDLGVLSFVDTSTTGSSLPHLPTTDSPLPAARSQQTHRRVGRLPWHRSPRQWVPPRSTEMPTTIFSIAPGQEHQSSTSSKTSPNACLTLSFSCCPHRKRWRSRRTSGSCWSDLYVPSNRTAGCSRLEAPPTDSASEILVHAAQSKTIAFSNKYCRHGSMLSYRL